uniref:Uncharacterized protein n=1 Tax=Arundo donax TaxID=35708 RepID=A0A0A9CC02_ARUDO
MMRQTRKMVLLYKSVCYVRSLCQLSFYEQLILVMST